MKIFFRICWLILLFAGSVYFFGNKLPERLSGEYVKTVETEGSGLPVLSIKTDGVIVNSLHGYIAQLDPCLVREDFVTLESEGVLEVYVYENKTDVRKLLYAFYDSETGEKLDEGQMSAFEYTETSKIARLKPQFEIQQGHEYVAELTFITAESKRVHYYFRIKSYDEAYFREKVQYMLDFSKACREKDIDFVIPFLESTYRGLGTNYSHVDIKDSYNMVCWGDLEPKLLSDIKVSVSEIFKYIAVGTLKYTVSLETPSGSEVYVVNERFRINMGADYVYLLNYERDMETVFDPNLISLSQSQLKFGVTGDTNPDMLWTDDKKSLTFIRSDIVWQYDFTENMLTKIYSMCDGYKYPSEVYDAHDIKLLRIDADGNVVFMVSGYVNCGEYEGKTGIFVYSYVKSENRIEELVYMPISETAGRIIHDISGFSYMNRQDVFFFMAYDRIYSYNLSTTELTTITNSVVSGDVVFCEKLSYVAWQEKGNMHDIFLLYPETGERSTLHVDGDNIITLLGYIGDKMITGYGKKSDFASYSDGSVYYPISELRILDSNEKVVKLYSEEGYYITDIDATPTSIRLTRVMKTDVGTNFYVPAPDDYILVYERAEEESFSVDTRITEKMLVEYYLSLPTRIEIEKLPEVKKTKLTVVKDNTTVYPDIFEAGNRFEVYSFGKIIGLFESFTNAILTADTDKAVGVVTYNGAVVWERGVQNRTSELSKEVLGTALLKTEEAIMQMQNLNHASLDEMLYFIYKDIPVYAVKDDGTFVLLTGYDQTHIMYRELDTGRNVTERTEKLSTSLEKGGNVFRVDIILHK